MAEIFDIKKTGDAWAKITIREAQQELDKKKIGKTGHGRASFSSVNKLTNNFTGTMEIRFAQYLSFVDMGVGKAVKIGDVKENSISRRLEGRQTGNRRRRKRWKHVLARESYRFGEIMSERAGRVVLISLKDAIENGNAR